MMFTTKSMRVTLAAILATISTGAVYAQQTPPATGQPAVVPEVPTAPPPQTPSIVPPVVESVPELVIEGHVVMRLRAQAGGMTSEERAYNLRQRLGPILSLPNLSSADVVVRQERPGQTASIYVRDRLLITVDRNLAKANQTSIEGLAIQWASNLRQALPRVNVEVRMSPNLLTRDVAVGSPQ